MDGHRPRSSGRTPGRRRQTTAVEHDRMLHQCAPNSHVGSHHFSGQAGAHNLSCEPAITRPEIERPIHRSSVAEQARDLVEHAASVSRWPAAGRVGGCRRHENRLRHARMDVCRKPRRYWRCPAGRALRDPVLQRHPHVHHTGQRGRGRAQDGHFQEAVSKSERSDLRGPRQRPTSPVRERTSKPRVSSSDRRPSRVHRRKSVGWGRDGQVPCVERRSQPPGARSLRHSTVVPVDIPNMLSTWNDTTPAAVASGASSRRPGEIRMSAGGVRSQAT